jgi:hypothetical protein
VVLGLTIFFADTGSTDQLKQLLHLVHDRKGLIRLIVNYVHHKGLLYHNPDRI